MTVKDVTHVDSPRWNADRRRQIGRRNELAAAVRIIMSGELGEPPVVTLTAVRENPSRRCPDCAGFGFRLGWRKRDLKAVNVPCPRCDGSGQIGVAR